MPECPRTPGLACPASPCLGSSDEGFCRHFAALAAWRAKTPEERDRVMAERSAGARPASDLDVRLAMAAELCPAGTGPCGCNGHPPRSCSHPDRPAEAWRPECLACAARAWWEAGVEGAG